jgi:hypothetical protein
MTPQSASRIEELKQIQMPEVWRVADDGFMMFMMFYVYM